MKFKDYYKILELEDSRVTIEQIKSAYRSLARKWHPDIAGSTKDVLLKFKAMNWDTHLVTNGNDLEAINEAAFKKGIVQDILLEVNISGEESKYGLTTDQIPTIIKEAKAFQNIAFRGFMTMAPLGAPKDEIRSIFRLAHNLFEEYSSEGAKILSMGMSGDFEIAIEEGATHIRVGRSIFKTL